MRIILFGNRGYASRVLEDLIARKANVVALCTKPPLPLRRKLRIRAGALMRWLHLRADVGHSLKGPFDDFPEPADIARAGGIEIIASKGLKSAATLARMTELKPDLILVAGFHRLIPPTIYGLARLAAINLHPGPLPQHRGGTPNRWIIRHGESHSCITAHLLSEEFDTGDIVAEKAISVRPQDTWGDLELRIVDAMPGVVEEIVAAVAEDRLVRRKQDAGLAAYEHSYGEKDRIIDWRLDAEAIRRTCYAIRPKSGGLTGFDGKPLCLWDLEAEVLQDTAVAPGQVVRVESNGDPVVACGGGTAARLTGFLDRRRLVPSSRLARRLGWSAGQHFDPAAPAVTDTPPDT